MTHPDSALTASDEESSPTTGGTDPEPPAVPYAPLGSRSRRTQLETALLIAAALAPVVLLVAAAWSRRWMHDDAFINLRVVRNLLIGNGPVFNIGERVEVGTSPLWIALLYLAGKLRIHLEFAAVYGALALTTIGMLAGELAALVYNRDSEPLLRRFRSRLMVPLGAAIFAVLPPAWDHATAGLETGLGLAWLGLSYLAVVRLGTPRVPGPKLWLLVAAFVGLGPLIRPDFSLFGLAFLLPLALACSHAVEPDERMRSRIARLARLVGAAGLIPVGYQLFRMGYYAAMSPNPALAKEAFRTNWEQGWCYTRNFFGLYHLAFPLTVVGIFALRAILQSRASRKLLASNVATALLIAAALHAMYVIAMGGDYMHARLFLPSVFASTLVVSLVSLRGLARSRLVAFAAALSLLPVLAWAALCGLFLRVDSKNQCDIGDERGWSVAGTGRKNPMVLEDFKGFTFYDAGSKEMHKLFGDRPSSSVDRRLFLGEDSDGRLYPPRAFYRLKKETDPRISGAATLAAIGIAGCVLPDNVIVVDRHGLSDPFGSRIELVRRGRPGHEKRLPNPWIVARLARPEFPDDAAVEAARRALACEPLRSLQRATTAPMTFGLFMSNLWHAPGLHWLRVPADPFEAERRFCDNEQLRAIVAGGEGGNPFRWHCPQGMNLCAVSGWFNEHEASVSLVRPSCCSKSEPPSNAPAAASLPGPEIGDRGSLGFGQTCNRGEFAVGIYGTHAKFLRSFGLICATLPASPSPQQRRVAVSGRDNGTPFELVCPNGQAAIGIAGRAGALIDALGVVCAP